jgi:hypothetical protein
MQGLLGHGFEGDKASEFVAALAICIVLVSVVAVLSKRRNGGDVNWVQWRGFVAAWLLFAALAIFALATHGKFL